MKRYEIKIEQIWITNEKWQLEVREWGQLIFRDQYNSKEEAEKKAAERWGQ